MHHASSLHDPYEQATPSQRLAAAARNERRAKIAARAVVDIPLSCSRRPPVLDIQEIVDPPATQAPSLDEWVKRQEQLNPLPKKLWFEIEAEIDAPPRKIAVKDIQVAVANHFGLTVLDIMSARKTADICKPRQIAMYLVCKLTAFSLADIGRRFGGRDHSTVHHSFRKIERLGQSDPKIAAALAAITAVLA